MRVKFVVFLWVIMTIVCGPCADEVCAAPESSNSDYINLPVFFVTDRQLKLNTSKNKYDYGKQIDHTETSIEDDLTFGIEKHRTRQPEGVFSNVWTKSFQLPIFGDRFSQKGMKWRTFSGLVYGHLFDWSDRGKYFEELNSLIDKCPGNELVVYVHGCCVDHRKACRQAVNIQKWFRRPVVLYDWGTELGNYYQSLISYPKTEARFNLFIHDLKQRFPNTKITIVAYSVGANILKNFCMSVADKESRLFESVILLRADTNIGELEKALPAVVKQSKNPVQIWVSRNDSQMLASRLLRVVTILPRRIVSFKGRRAGETNAWLEKRYDGVQVVDISKLGLGHEIPFKQLPLFGKLPLQEGSIGDYTLVKSSDNLFYASKSKN